MDTRLKGNATELPVVTLLLVGKTGNGKSSTANTILRAGEILGKGQASADKTPFTLAHSFSSATTTIELGECIIDGKTRVKVINTPDLANTKRTSIGEVSNEVDSESSGKDKKTEKSVNVDTWVKMESQRWIEACGGKPNAVVLVIRCDGRYTKEEMDIYTQLKEVLGDRMKGNLVIVFTVGDFLDGEGVILEDTLKEACPELKGVLKDAENRYVIFDNKTRDEAKKKTQVQSLLAVVQKMDGKTSTYPFKLWSR